MRRLLWLVSASVFFNTIFLAALTPLLPLLARELDLSKSESGLLVASYAAGVLAAAVPAGYAMARLGARTTLVLGLLLMAGSSVLFAFAPNVLVLDVARLGQGAASATGWMAAMSWLVTRTPRQRRGELIAVTMSATVLGALMGPVLGAAAGVFGTGAAFTAVALIGVALACWALATPAAPAVGRQPLRPLARALAGEHRIRLGLWLGAVTALVFGAVSTLAPLRLGELGWSSVAVGATYFTAAAVQSLCSPLLGRWSDRVGRLTPVRASLAVSAVVLLGFALADARFLIAFLVVVLALANSVLWVSGVAVVADGSDAAALEPGFGFTLMNAAWAPGYMAGAALGGALAAAAGDAAPYLLLVAVCLALRAAVHGRELERLPGEPRELPEAA